MAEHNLLGEKGEELAREFLQNLGYKIIAMNWRERKFEIDLIATDKKEVVFVEVKTRSTDFFGNPEEAVTIKKQRHLIEGADFYIQENEIVFVNWESINKEAVVLNSNQKEVKHIKSAFSPSF